MAYVLYRVDAQRKVTVAAADDRYAPNEGVALSVSNNVPGMLDVFNVDGLDRRTLLETVRLEAPRTTVLPARTQGFYQFDGAQGDETLILRLYPCNPTLTTGAPEALSIAAAPEISRQITSFAELKPDVSRQLTACPTLAERDSRSGGQSEALSIAADTNVAVAVANAAAQSSAGLKPVTVRIVLKRKQP